MELETWGRLVVGAGGVATGGGPLEETGVS